MLIYGITGPSGAGKTLLGEYFAKHDVPHIDADAVYHAMLRPASPAVEALKNVFGERILSEDGGIDRQALGAIVFHDPQKLELLNKTVLDLVLDEIRRILSNLKKEGCPLVAIDAPTLIESGFHKECDRVIVVLCPQEQRLERIVARDGISYEQARQRIDAQKKDSFYQVFADDILWNDGDRDAFFRQADTVFFPPSN